MLLCNNIYCNRFKVNNSLIVNFYWAYLTKTYNN